MANYKVVDADKLDADLTSVADVIRSVGGTEDKLAFPLEWETAIRSLAPETLENIPIELNLAEGNQTITAPDGYVVKSATIEKPSDLVPENILADKEIAGVVGTLMIPEILEDVEIQPDFTNGDQIIVVPEGYVVRSAVIQKPETLIPANIAEGVDIGGVVGTLSVGGGGGSSGDVRYVTFMSYDGTEEHGRIPVAVGYDCPNPKFTVTRESTAQYNFVHDAWATEPNGATDANALKAVTEDRVVYATFISVLRYYTITFYDDDGATVPTTKSVAYGSVPSYTPTKDGYDFVGWEPELAAVIGEASYTATWKAKAGFATATWAEISAITTAGTSADSFAVGDTRNEVLTYSDGTTEDIELVISKIRSDGSMVLALNHALETLKQMHNSGSGAAANYFNNDLGKYLTNTIAPALPAEFRAVIRKAEVIFSDREIRLPTRENLTNGNAESYSVLYEGLPLFTTLSNRIRRRKTDGVAVKYWTGSYSTSGSHYIFEWVTTEGLITHGGAINNTDANGVVFLVDV